MAQFGQKSLARLRTLDPTLRVVLRRAIQFYDFAILVGHRGEEEQNAAFAAGNSQLKYPRSKHNKTPSEAVDVAPWPIDWQDTERFVFLAGIIYACAHELGVGDRIRWGGDWDRDGEMSDERFRDYGHFEVV